MGSGIRLVLKGKVPLLPHRIAGWSEVAEVIEACEPTADGAARSEAWN